MTEEEFDTWLDEQPDIRAEWADGKVYVMSNATFYHNILAMWLGALLTLFVEERNLGVVASDNQMRLRQQRRRRLPDVYFVRKERMKLMNMSKGVMDGPFDLAIEIVSDSDPVHDYVTKFREYESAGVAEYWIADPQNRHLSGWRLADGVYVALDRDDVGRMHSRVLPGLWVRQADLFADPRPTVASALAQLEAKSEQ